MSADGTTRDGSRLEVDDVQHCKECGLEIEVDLESTDGLVWNHAKREWEFVEKCAACKAEESLEGLSHLYQTDVAFDVRVRGLDVESEVVR